MQSYTTQSHQRNYQGNVVMPHANQNRAKKKRHQLLAGITTTVMALAVVVTGGLLGATAIHNHQLKNEVQTLRIQAQSTVQENQGTEESHRPMTLELKPIDEEQTETNQNKDTKKCCHPKKRPQKAKTYAN